MLEILRNKSLVPFLVLAFIQIIVCILGVYNYYSAIPFWDMWDGYLEFYNHILNGEYKYIFLQHNEHRIIFSKIFFIIDIAMFNGRSYFLLLLNLILMGLISYQFFKYIDKLSNNILFNKNIIKFFVIILIFSWVQQENITWGFQSQFFLAYLLPAFSFYLMALHKETLDVKYFYYACLIGVLSAYTMANGILTSIILVIMVFIYRLGIRKISIAIIIMILNNIIFFTNYSHIDRQGSIIHFLIHSPIDFLSYIFIYLGSPFFYLFAHISLLPSKILGFILVISTLIILVKYFKRILDNNFLIAIIMLQGYIFVTAIVTASGRFSFGMEQAISGRYTTPSLISWTILFILVCYFYNIKSLIIKKFLYIIILLISILFVAYEFKSSLSNQLNMKLERELGTLSISLNVRDVSAIQRVCPEPNMCMQVGNNSILHKISIFDDESYGLLNQSLNKSIQNINMEKTNGYIDSLEKIESDSYKIKGWLFDKDKKNQKKLLILDEMNNILGYVISGYSREDIMSIYGISSKDSGFIGYIKSDKLPKEIKIFSLDTNKYISNPVQLQINEKKIVKFEQNKVYSGLDLNGYEIYGSYISGDKDFAKSEINYNENILYKTGPKSNYQKIEIYIEDKLFDVINLEQASEWKKLPVNLKEENKNNAKLIFIDDSDRWGEWSAFAIKKGGEFESK